MTEDELFVLLASVSAAPTLEKLQDIEFILLDQSDLRPFVHKYDVHLISNFLKCPILFDLALEILILCLDEDCVSQYTNKRKLFLLTDQLYMNRNVRIIAAVTRILVLSSECVRMNVVGTLESLGFFRIMVALACKEGAQLMDSLFVCEGTMNYTEDEVRRIRMLFNSDAGGGSLQTYEENASYVLDIGAAGGSCTHGNKNGLTCETEPGILPGHFNGEKISQDGATREPELRTLPERNKEKGGIAHLGKHPFDVKRKYFDTKTYFKEKEYFKRSIRKTHKYSLVLLKILSVFMNNLRYFISYLPCRAIDFMVRLNERVINNRAIMVTLKAMLIPYKENVLERFLEEHDCIHVLICVIDRNMVMRKDVLSKLKVIKSSGAIFYKLIDDLEVLEQIRGKEWNEVFFSFLTDECEHVQHCTEWSSVKATNGIAESSNACLVHCKKYQTLVLLSKLPLIFKISKLMVVNHWKAVLCNHVCVGTACPDFYQREFLNHLRSNYLNFARVLFSEVKIRERERNTAKNDSAEDYWRAEQELNASLVEEGNDAYIGSENFMSQDKNVS
ncbi:hypothetical protein VCUG_02624 [Vavraia culicis subsp. floridensis]|uniref:Uncharacterized protein n=1 Tax=Vavraia culicis (isolate floridensis) TaxID=948595 RepID=L2GRJ7_VAVCU|nr:uncharacterized protein VCUG_02624 [Vavraia culicis subsp. floridensis]ELA45888.1 hypothetical protein VCUG_02624 [Vavraia culicis subsp. floridensis]